MLAEVASSTQNLGNASAFTEAKVKMLTAAQAEGRSLTPEQIAEIDRLALAYANAGNEAEKARAKMDLMDQMKADPQKQLEGGVNAITGVFTAATQGADELSNALSNVGQQIMQALMNKMIMSLIGGVGGGFAASLGGLLGFASGGYTGHGGKFEPAGVVHRGEFVMSKAATTRLGVGNLEALHQSALRGYADGGLVGGKALPSVGGKSGRTAPQIHIKGGDITVNASGGTPEQNGDLAKQVARESEAMMRGLIQNELVRQMRPGGMMR